jgi:hypothetical protein
MFPSTAFDETLKPVRPLEYVRFCTTEGGSRLYVIARIESKDSLGRLWGHWYSTKTRTGEFKEIPWQFDKPARMLEPDSAETCIHALRAGNDLPEERVRSFPNAD